MIKIAAISFFLSFVSVFDLYAESKLTCETDYSLTTITENFTAYSHEKEFLGNSSVIRFNYDDYEEYGKYLGFEFSHSTCKKKSKNITHSDVNIIDAFTKEVSQVILSSMVKSNSKISDFYFDSRFGFSAIAQNLKATFYLASGIERMKTTCRDKHLSHCFALTYLRLGLGFNLLYSLNDCVNVALCSKLHASSTSSSSIWGLQIEIPLTLKISESFSSTVLMIFKSSNFSGKKPIFRNSYIDYIKSFGLGFSLENKF